MNPREEILTFSTLVLIIRQLAIKNVHQLLHSSVKVLHYFMFVMSINQTSKITKIQNVMSVIIILHKSVHFFLFSVKISAQKKATEVAPRKPE